MSSLEISLQMPLKSVELVKMPIYRKTKHQKGIELEEACHHLCLGPSQVALSDGPKDSWCVKK